MFKIDHNDLMWLAGVVEGEGCIDAQRGRYPRLRVAMCDRDVIGRVADLLGTSVRLTLRGAPATATWHSEVQGEKAAEILRALLPYMGARRSARIAEVLSVRMGENASAPGPRITRPPGIARAA